MANSPPTKIGLGDISSDGNRSDGLSLRLVVSGADRYRDPSFQSTPADNVPVSSAAMVVSNGEDWTNFSTD